MVFNSSNGIYRGVILAVAGLILIGASEPPKQSAKSEKTKTAQPKPQSLPTITPRFSETFKTVESSKKAQPCGPTRYQSNEDLCAQWKAADSAAEAAHWARWQTFLSAMGVLGLLASLYYTRQAVMVAESATKDADDALIIAARNADSAADHVKIAERTAEKQLRAYVNIIAMSFTRLPDGNLAYQVQYTNTGQTPAKNMRVITRLISSIDSEAKGKIFFGKGGGSRSVFATSQIAIQNTPLTSDLRNTIEAIKVTGKFLVCAVYISYVDVFGKLRRTIGKGFVSKETINGENFGITVCIKGSRSS
jgi:hypothetical protein